MHILLASSNLTESRDSIKPALQALASKTKTTVDSSIKEKIAAHYANLSQDQYYKNAHKVYRLLAAMTLTGNDQVLDIVDKIWESGLAKKTNF